MKRYVVIVMLLCVCLLGCSRDVPLSDPTLPSEAPPPTYPVDEDVFYFSNELEYSRLYRQREDGTGLELILDAYCYGVQQQGDTVYYTVDSSLCAYHIPTGTHQLLAKNVLDYYADGEDAVVMAKELTHK